MRGFVKINVDERTRKRLKALAAEQGVSLKDLLADLSEGRQGRKKSGRGDVWDFRL